MHLCDDKIEELNELLNQRCMRRQWREEDDDDRKELQKVIGADEIQSMKEEG